MHYSPLHIPKKYRDLRQGCYVVCYKNGVKKIRDKCCQTGKKISTCKHGVNHRYQSRVKDLFGKGSKYKSWPKGLRDLNEFFRLHLQYKETLHEGKTKPIDSKPGLLSDCLAYYVDFINDIDVPSYEKKNNSKGHIVNQVANLKHMIKALKESGEEPNHLPIVSFESMHVSMIHDYVEKNFANKTYNDKMLTYQAFFEFLIAKGYQLNNPFKNLKRKHTEARREIVTLSQFKSLCEATTEVGGVKFENKGNGRFSKVQIYRDWLVEGWEFSLYSGCRRSEVANIKVADVKKDHLICRNEKVSNLKKREVIRIIPIPEELKKLLDKVLANRKPDQYLIAPDETNRKRVGNQLSKAFSHYWDQLGQDKRTMKDLRNTYSTAMLLAKEQKGFSNIGLHENDSTTLRHYGNELELVRAVNGKKIYK